MSYTEIYSVSDGEIAPPIKAEVQNAHRGAMYVWNQIARDYFGLENFPLFDKHQQGMIWNAYKTHALSYAERIVLISTLDYAAVRKGDVKNLIKAFRDYGSSNPHSSYCEQAGVIKGISESMGDDQFIVWNQTSVNADLPFAEYEEDEHGEWLAHVQLSKCWDVFKEESNNVTGI